MNKYERGNRSIHSFVAVPFLYNNDLTSFPVSCRFGQEEMSHTVQSKSFRNSCACSASSRGALAAAAFRGASDFRRVRRLGRAFSAAQPVLPLGPLHPRRECPAAVAFGHRRYPISRRE